MRHALPLLIAIAAFGSAAPAVAEDPPKVMFTEAARAKFGAAPSAADIVFSNGAVTADDMGALVDQCLKVVARGPGYWPTLKADGWLLESGRDIPADVGWEGLFIKPGLRGKLVEHISQGDIAHCEARGEPSSAAAAPTIRSAMVARYGAVSAIEFKGDNGFIENIREAAPKLLRGLYVSSTNAVFGFDPDAKSSTVSINVFAAPPLPTVGGTEDVPSFASATQASILAGAKACLGSTLDGADRTARFTGWTPATPEQRKQVSDGGSAVIRSNVMIAYKPGKDGGCVVMAKRDGDFDSTTFYPQLGALVGVKLSGDKPKQTNLPNGEMIIPVVSPPTGTAPDLFLVFANRAGQNGKKEN